MSRFVSRRVNIGRIAIRAEKFVVMIDEMTDVMKGVLEMSAGEMTGVTTLIRVAIRGATEESKDAMNVIDSIVLY
jgi:hypothetical protein